MSLVQGTFTSLVVKSADNYRNIRRGNSIAITPNQFLESCFSVFINFMLDVIIADCMMQMINNFYMIVLLRFFRFLVLLSLISSCLKE